MKIEFVTNACAIYESHGFRLVSDPWLTDGAFEGSWCHYPPVRTTPAELAARTDALYISHAHPDHYDERTLAVFPRDIPIIILDQPPNILRRLLTNMGFTNLILSKSGERRTIGPFEYDLLKAFDEHHFETAALDNILDSACFLKSDGVSVMNFNDNIPSEETCERLVRLYPDLTMIQVQYTAAGPFPSCFTNLGHDEQLTASERVRDNYATHTGVIAKIMRPKFLMPFAGQFVIGGRLFEKNRVLGTTTPHHAAERCKEIATNVETVLLSEGMSIDLPSGNILGGPYNYVHEDEQFSYVQRALASIRYPHEDAPEDVSNEDLAGMFASAFANFRQKQKALDYFPDVVLAIDSDHGAFEFDLKSGDSGLLNGDGSLTKGRDHIRISTDRRLLPLLLSGKVHWNNAMVGMHLDFHRSPERYDPDVYTALSYFHAPKRG